MLWPERNPPHSMRMGTGMGSGETGGAEGGEKRRRRVSVPYGGNPGDCPLRQSPVRHTGPGCVIRRIYTAFLSTQDLPELPSIGG